MKGEEVGIAISWGICIPFGLSLICAFLRALWEIRRGDRKAARHLVLMGWADNIHLILKEICDDSEGNIRSWMLPATLIITISLSLFMIGKSGVTWSSFGITVLIITSGAPLMTSYYGLLFISRLSRFLRLAEAFHLITQNKFRRIYPVPELVPLIIEFRSNKEFRFLYRLARVDDAKGGFWGVGDLLSGLLKTEKASLWELERYHLALKWTIERHATMGAIADTEINRYREVINLFEKAMFSARSMLEDMRTHDEIIGAMDIASKQAKIAFWSAIGSIASALAAFAAAAIAFMSKN